MNDTATSHGRSCFVAAAAAGFGVLAEPWSTFEPSVYGSHLEPVLKVVEVLSPVISMVIDSPGPSALPVPDPARR